MLKPIRTLLIVLIFAFGMRSLYSTLINFFVPLSVLRESELLFRFIGKVILYSILIIVPICLYRIKKPEATKILGGKPKSLHVIIASLLGLSLLAFAYGEDGIETFLLAQVDVDLAYSFWAYPPNLTRPEYNFAEWLLLCLGSVIIAPFAEEFFFRGLLLSELSRRFDKRSAAFYSSCLFTLLHYSNLHVISTMVFSLALCRIYITTSSLWLCAVVHGIFNFGALLIENFALNNIVQSYEELPIFSNWKLMFILFLTSSCILIYARCWVKEGVKLLPEEDFHES
ncbi:lysostaphin resistance A-like protein [Telluria sp. B2]